MLTIGYHTCRVDGGREIVLENSPFLAEHLEDVNPPKYQFLGTGYYFWDNNIELAKWWGKTRLKDGYFIVQMDFNLTSETCFDLVGNREHQIYLIETLKDLEFNKGMKRDNWTICQCINYLKELENVSKTNLIFPYFLIRAVDLTNHKADKNQYKIKFSTEKDNYSLLSPRIIICATNTERLLMDSKKIV